MKHKKNYDYIASVEKSIVEKYGKEAVQDFRSAWDSDKEKQYLHDLKERNTLKNPKENIVILIDGAEIRSGSTLSKTNRTCPVCKTYSFSGRDDLYMNRFKCCYECYVDFVAHEEERWTEGWRPDPEHLAYAYNRRRKNGNSTRDS